LPACFLRTFFLFIYGIKHWFIKKRLFYFIFYLLNSVIIILRNFYFYILRNFFSINFFWFRNFSYCNFPYKNRRLYVFYTFFYIIISLAIKILYNFVIFVEKLARFNIVFFYQFFFIIKFAFFALENSSIINSYILFDYIAVFGQAAL